MKIERKKVVILLSMLVIVILFFFLVKVKPVCQENWLCNNWSSCSNSLQTRNCNDLNTCGTVLSKPINSQSCVNVCTPKWTCTAWSTCLSSFQTRSCTDSNKCNILTGKPIVSQSCTLPPVPEPIKFETNAIGGYDSYKSGTWIKLDSNNDKILEQYDYIGTITGGSCLGSLFLTTPDGLVITKYDSYFYVCSPSNGYKRYRSI